MLKTCLRQLLRLYHFLVVVKHQMELLRQISDVKKKCWKCCSQSTEDNTHGFVFWPWGLYSLVSTECKLADPQQRRVFADWVFEMHQNNVEFHRKISLSDQTHFHFSGYVNKPSCCIWDMKPQDLLLTTFTSSTCNCLCGLWSDEVIEP